MTLAILTLYLLVVLSIGLLSNRSFRGTGEDYFVATRTIGPFVLLMSLFGTHMTAFALLGSSGESYRKGVGVFGLMASAAAIVIPLLTFFIGLRIWSVGKRFGFLTQAQYFRARWESDRLGLVLFVVLVALVVPYLLIGVMGAGLTVSQITGGQVPQWVGSLVVTAVVLVYVTFGGLRGTAWVNTFQTLVFMTLGAVTAVYIFRELGGMSAALEQISQKRPDLLVREGRWTPTYWTSYLLIPLSGGMFPHLFNHWLSARKSDAFRLTIVAYPICLAIVWLPAVLLGLFGHLTFPDLQGPEASSVLIRMIFAHAPEALAGLLGAGVFAAVMSSLDSQSLAIGSMFTNDIVDHYGFRDGMSEERRVLAGRLFVAGVLTITYLWSLVANTTIFGMAIWSFTGFAGLFPLVVAALYWKRSTKQGAFAVVLTVAVLWSVLFKLGSGTPGFTVGGFPPVAVVFAASSIVMIAVSLMTQPPSRETVEKFFPNA